MKSHGITVGSQDLNLHTLVPEPKSGVSANFTTPAKRLKKHEEMVTFFQEMVNQNPSYPKRHSIMDHEQNYLSSEGAI